MERHQASDTITEPTQLYPQAYHPQRNPCLEYQCMGSFSGPSIKEHKKNSSEQCRERSCYIDMNNAMEEQYVVKSIPSSRNYCYNPVVRQTHLKQDEAVLCKPLNFTCPPVYQTSAHSRLLSANDHPFRSTIVQWVPSESSSQTKIVLNSFQNMKIESSQLNMPTEPTR